MATNRANNFTARETQILLELAGRYEDVLENKKRDAYTNNLKIKTWVELSHKFNLLSGEEFRDSRVLRNKYDNIKKRARGTSATLDFSYNEYSSDEFEGDVKNITEEQMKTNGFNANSMEKPEETIIINIQRNEDETTKENMQQFFNIEKPSSPKDLPILTKINSPVPSPPEKNVSKKEGKFIVGTLKLKMKFLEEEHALRMQYLEKFYKQELEIQSLKLQMHQKELEFRHQEHREKLKIMNEEHNKKLKLIEKNFYINML